jgi:ATP-dependent Clp protease protease subunit
MKYLPSVLETALSVGLDLKRGTILLNGEVCEEMFQGLVHRLMALGNSGKAYKQLTIVLNTYGGDLYQALAIYDLIKIQPMKTIVQCNGPVMSAGTVILQAGDERTITQQSCLMYHFGQQVAESQQGVAHLSEINKQVKHIYKEKTKVSQKTINSWFEKETYYNAQEALRLGIVDRIIKYEEKIEN